MIKIPARKERLEVAKEAHSQAVVNYVKEKDGIYQKQLYDNISRLMPQVEPFEILVQKNDWCWLSNFILADVKMLTSFVQCKNLLQFNEFKDMYSSKFSNGATTYLDKQTHYNAYCLCKNLGIEICPYCDDEYLDILMDQSKRTIRTLEIDHFYSKSDYPALAMCFFNLIPCGQNCNGMKGTEIIGMNPYETNIEECTWLYPDFPVGINMEKVSVSDCEIKFHPKQGMDKNVDVFRLEERYKKHKGVAHKYIRNLQFYTDEKIDELIRMGFFESKDEVYRDLFDIPLPEDDTQHPLSKLRRDIVGK